MKKILTIFAALSLLSSCNYLAFDETSGLYTHDDCYKNFDNAKKMLTNIYSYLAQDLGCLNGAMRDCASDDAEYGDVGAAVQNFNNGSWSSVKTLDNGWAFFKAVRSANDFIANIRETDYSRYRYDADYANMEKQLRYFEYEARVLRAYFFFELSRRYGDIPMPLSVMTTAEANSIGKTAYEDVVEFIVSECDACVDKLPETYIGEPNNETGRITRGYAMALKSKTLLYAASKLHNPSMDAAKWKRSAKAALDIIESGLYRLDPADKCNNPTSPEIVLVRMNPDGSNFELNNFPIRFTEAARTKAASGNFPTQNLVDAFQTKNGYTATLAEDGWHCDDPKFNARSPYANRDPRFSRAILANGNYFKSEAIALYEGGADAVPVSAGGSPTGYFLRKYVQETTNFDPNRLVTNKHQWVIYRYAETLLAYAESMIEAFSDPNYSDAEYKYSAAWALNQVRTNVSMPKVTVTDKGAFIEAVRNEWRVEFAFEDHRFWDIRRWKIGSDTQRTIYGAKVTRNGTANSYKRFTVETRSWGERMYLYPFPMSELYINPNLAPQNKGW